MENLKFDGAKQEEIITPEKNESLESLQERIEVLQGVVDEFDSEVVDALQLFEVTARVSYSKENGYDDKLKLEGLTKLIGKLSIFEAHLQSIISLFESKDGADGLNVLWSSVNELKKQVSVAPSPEYSKAAQIEKYGGRENIPGEETLNNFEHTLELILLLRGEVKGISGALKFMNPKKIIE